MIVFEIRTYPCTLSHTPLAPPPALPFFHEYVVGARVHVYVYPHTHTHSRASVHACKYTDNGAMYDFVAHTSNCCTREHRAGVDVYDKFEIPFRADYVLLSFGWVTTDPPRTYTQPLSPLSCLTIYRVV